MMEDDAGTPEHVDPDHEEEEDLPASGYNWDVVYCKGLKADGTPCRAIARKSSGYCQRHDPGITLESTKAEAPKWKGGKLKPYPFHDGGVNENAAIRVIRMVIPQCPVDSLPEIKNKDGSYSPNPNFSGEQNCQQIYKKNNSGVWDVEECERRGHDPWHTTFRRPILEEVLDDEGYVKTTRVKYKVEKRLNVIQVSLNSRHTNGMEVALAQAKGCKFLEDFGIASPCEFRNCSQPQRIETRVGKYCSERHARLVAADARGVFLPATGGGDPYTADRMTREREELLENLNIRQGG